MVQFVAKHLTYDEIRDLLDDLFNIDRNGMIVSFFQTEIIFEMPDTEEAMATLKMALDGIIVDKLTPKFTLIFKPSSSFSEPQLAELLFKQHFVERFQNGLINTTSKIKFEVV